MNYLILKPKGQLSYIKMVDADSSIELPFCSWALKSGSQILFVYQKLHKVLKGFHMHGTYQDGATFGYSHDDMKAILTKYLGEDDETRLMILRGAHESDPGVKAEHHKVLVRFLAYFTIEGGSFMFKVVWMASKFVGLMLILPIALHMFNKNKR